mmetsp:Transcript_11584/g.43508  ORF Transcript_11584/g.43508 Transcript_11584/m.43508 type:complete len:482 (-) Transcript_11584:247-1692(-)|eukprot:CAMPEP_0117440970 /NCGR_PEP_ID=MMETSP0759-20121206/3375_1 /TAXON_ID=63605 /ORGANISM="Percolomonas cosmopolitus, Strain WS" /LENGTH=481 /DNA_ID=CAMNT_0005232773 /DNA_START=186 /DNA_END=1631 /DNA_ORIENTATION=+
MSTSVQHETIQKSSSSAEVPSSQQPSFSEPAASSSSIPPFELKKLVHQTLNLQKQVQLAQKTAHNRMLALKNEIDQLNDDNFQKERKIKKIDMKLKHFKKKNEEHAALITKLKPYKVQYQQLTLQNAELTQKLQKYKENAHNASMYASSSMPGSALSTTSTSTTGMRETKMSSSTTNGASIPTGSHSKLHNSSFGTPSAHDMRHHLERRLSSSSLRGDDSDIPRRSSLDHRPHSKRNSTASLNSPLNQFPALSIVLNEFNQFNNALMNFLDATTHLSIFDSCFIVHALIVACQKNIDSMLDKSTDTILDTLYSAHNQTADTNNADLFKRDQFKHSKIFQNFIKQFRQIEYQSLLDKDKMTSEIIEDILTTTECVDKNIEPDTFQECIQSILPIIWKFTLKGLKFKSNQQEDLKGKTWDIAKYDLLDSGSERVEEITVVVRPSLVRKNGKEVKKSLVCCAPEESTADGGDGQSSSSSPLVKG